MRSMTSTEIQSMVDRVRWSTICTVSPDGRPHAIEATPFRDMADICFMINPAGQTRRNVASNPAVLLKFTLADWDLSGWAGVSLEGEGRFDENPVSIRRGFARLGKIMGGDYTSAGIAHSRKGGSSPMLRVTVREMSGRCGGRFHPVSVWETSQPAERFLG